MPDFNGVTPLIEKQTWSITYVWVDGTQKTRTFPQVSDGATDAQRDALISNSVLNSNAGMVKWQGNGQRARINVTQATVLDEAHGINSDLELTFEQAGTLDTTTYRIPAPAAELFTGGVTLVTPDDAAAAGTVEKRSGDLVTACLAALNEGVAVGSEWRYASGYLSTAPASAKRKIPGNSQIIEPATGTSGDDPGENP